MEPFNARRTATPYPPWDVGGIRQPLVNVTEPMMNGLGRRVRSGALAGDNCTV
jgi:hypothetical protein